MIEYVMILFMNGWPVEVDRFKDKKECDKKIAAFQRSNSKPDKDFKIWCQQINK